MKRGFTLIEVLVVVAIIALLVSILIPSLSQARDQARSAKCLANMRDMSTGVSTFAATHQGRFQLVTGGPAQPPPNNPTSGPNADPDRRIYAYESGLSDPNRGPALLGWPVVLLREGGVRSLRKNADWGIQGQSNALAQKDKIPVFEQMLCPADGIKFGTPFYPYGSQWGESFGYLSYGINEDVTGDRSDATDAPPVWKDGNKGMSAGAGERLLGKLDRVIRPGEVLMFVDAGSDKPLGQQAGNAHLIISGGATPPSGPLLEYFEKAWGGRLPAQRHRRGSLNVTYVDGHGGFVKRTKVANPPSGAPDFAYVPKVRVSPYNPGNFPVP